MNFDGYFSIFSENDEFQNDQLWIPEIPEKSRAITSPMDSVDLGSFYDYAPLEPNSMICHITGGNSSGYPSGKETINNVPGMCEIGFTDLLTEGVEESERNICMTDDASVPSLYSHVDNSSQFSSSLGSLLSNGDLCSSGVSLNCMQKCPPISAMLHYNTNAEKHAESHTTSSLTHSSKFTKTDQMKRSENQKLQEVLSLIFEDPVQGEEHVSSLKIQDVEKQCNDLLYSCIHPPSVALSSFPEENQALNNVGDLNATPLKKPPKRRKHRPKVVIEGKPRKSSKSEATKAENSKEKRAGKRKYVRKNFHNGTEKITESKIRSCSRVINFGTENPKDGCIIKATDQGQCFKELGSPLLKLSSCIQADGEEAEPFPTVWTQACYSPFTDINSVPEMNTDAQISHHGGSPITEIGETYFGISRRSQIPIPEVIKLNSKQVSHRDHQNQQTSFNFIGKVDGQAQNNLRNNVNSTMSLMVSSSKSVETSDADRNQKKYNKRDHASITNTQIYSHIHTTSSSLCQIQNQGCYVDDRYTHGEKKQKVVSDGMESSNTHFSSAENHYEHGGGNNIIDDSFLSQAYAVNNCSNAINESIRNWLLRSASSDFYRGGGQCYSDLNPYMRRTETKTSNMLTLFPDMIMTGEKMNSMKSMDTKSSPTHRVKSRSDIKHRTVLAKKIAMEQSKETVQHPVNSSDNSLVKFGDVEAFGWFPNNIDHDRRFPGNGLSSKWKQMNQIEEIEYKFKLLTINDESSRDLLCLQNSIVPYKVDGKIVPYEGIYSIKKRKPRPKVDLDPETDRLWKLLMGKNCEEAAGPDADKERYWKEEREVFRGRADSFIARMHLVQGDRRFSQWKGSVVDSVIGVFLTQNVSDHLSSSAFMSLAAQFPLKSMESMSYFKDDSDLPPEPEIIDFVEPLCNYSGITDLVPQNDRQELAVLAVSWYLSSPEQISEEIISSHESLDTLSAKAVEASRSSSGSNSVVSNSEADDSATAHKANPIHDSLDHWTLNVTEDFYCDRNRSSFYHSPLHSHLHEETQNWQHINPQGEENTEKILAEIASPLTSSTSTVIQLPSSPNNYTLNFTPNIEVPHLEKNFTSWPSVIHRKVTKDDTIEGSHLECGQETHLKDPRPEKRAIVDEHLLSSSLYQLQSHNFQQTGGALHTPSMSTTVKSHYIEGYAEKDNNLLYQFMYPSAAIGEVGDEICASSLEVNNKNNNAVTKFDNKITGNNLKAKAYSSDKMLARKGKEKYGNSVCDWKQFRKEVQSSSGKRGMNIDTMDSLDYEAIRNADVDVISATIRERGMNNMLAERIKGFLDRIVAEHGSIDLEWLRDAPPDKAKDYLLSIRGLGLKSVECVRLLTLHHLAFPVDTNVGRIAVRLGWVPLQPLPESLQLHLLELYPVLESIQKYLWPRLCKLDQRTLYELHYQMITFGKVFCTKSRPNCNACPMRGECRHFASAFASARLSLPGPEDRSIICKPIPITDTRNPISSNLMPLPSFEQEGSRVTNSEVVNCEPIIEEPETPEPDVPEITEADIEDTFCEDPEEIPIIRLNVKEFTTNIQSYMQENNIDFNEGGMSKALVALDPASASIPAPKLKNVSRLRTEHQVYELPDSHPLLLEMDRREPDDPSPYLLAIWTPGETANSIIGSEISCGHLESSATCSEDACLSCSSIREANSQTVRGTLLIPCRTATRGSFPLNGTYFQVNEMFADHDSSLNPIIVPRTWIWNLPRRTVYFGTSVSTIFKGLSTEGIQYCFWRGFVCVRGFDKNTRAPRPLMARLHFPASKLPKMKIVK